MECTEVPRARLLRLRSGSGNRVATDLAILIVPSTLVRFHGNARSVLYSAQVRQKPGEGLIPSQSASVHICRTTKEGVTALYLCCSFRTQDKAEPVAHFPEMTIVEGRTLIV